jgi:hypothetical protein
MPSSFLLFEKLKYPHTHVDSKNRVHLFVPVTLGEKRVGKNNKCKTADAIKQFFNDPHNRASYSLSSHSQDIADDISVIEAHLRALNAFPSKAREKKKWATVLADKKSRYEELRIYKQYILPAIAEFQPNRFNLPQPMINAAKDSDSNLALLSISTTAPDFILNPNAVNPLPGVPPLFGTAVNDIGRFINDCFGEGLRKMLKNAVITPPPANQVLDVQARLIQPIHSYLNTELKKIEKYKQGTKSTRENVKSLMAEIKTLLKNLGLERSVLDVLDLASDATVSEFYLGGTITENEDLAENIDVFIEIVENRLNELSKNEQHILAKQVASAGLLGAGAAALATATNFEEESNEVFARLHLLACEKIVYRYGDNNNQPRELFSVACQLFLASISIAYCEWYGDRVNLGQVLTDVREKEREDLFGRIKKTLKEEQGNIETTLFDFVWENFCGSPRLWNRIVRHSTRPLHKLEEERRHDFKTAVQTIFHDITNALYIGVKNSDQLNHYHNFIVILEKKAGPFYTLNPNIVVHASHYLKYANPNLYSKYWNDDTAFPLAKRPAEMTQQVDDEKEEKDDESAPSNQCLGDNCIDTPRLEITDIFALSAQPVHLIAALLATENQFEKLSAEERYFIKRHPHYPDIYQKLLHTINQRREAAKIRAKIQHIWGDENDYVIGDRMAGILCAEVFQRHGKHCLLGYTGTKKLEKALELLGNDKIQATPIPLAPHSDGGIISLAKRKKLKDIIDGIYQRSKRSFYVTHSMVTSLKLAEINNTSQDVRENFQQPFHLEKALQALGNYKVENITADNTGFCVKTSNPTDAAFLSSRVEEIYQIYLQTRPPHTLTLTDAEVKALSKKQKKLRSDNDTAHLARILEKNGIFFTNIQKLAKGVEISVVDELDNQEVQQSGRAKLAHLLPIPGLSSAKQLPNEDVGPPIEMPTKGFQAHLKNYWQRYRAVYGILTVLLTAASCLGAHFLAPLADFGKTLVMFAANTLNAGLADLPAWAAKLGFAGFVGLTAFLTTALLGFVIAAAFKTFFGAKNHAELVDVEAAKSPWLSPVPELLKKSHEVPNDARTSPGPAQYSSVMPRKSPIR